jgi:hypothetical protein
MIVQFDQQSKKSRAFDAALRRRYNGASTYTTFARAGPMPRPLILDDITDLRRRAATPWGRPIAQAILAEAAGFKPCGAVYHFLLEQL